MEIDEAAVNESPTPVVAHAGMTLSGSIDDYPGGVIIPIDKPYRWTSADVIRKVKYSACRHFGKKNLKVGHAGTLDPLATGVLLVCIGKATKLAEELQRHPKEYLAGVSFGATTPSYDLEKEIDAVYPLEQVSAEALAPVLASFVGEQEQIAPLFSAKSVDGVRAYELARKAYKESVRSGEEFDHTAAELLSKQKICINSMKLEDFFDGAYSSQKVCRSEKESGEFRANERIHVADVSGYKLKTAMVRVGCTKGTYIRALARDLGEAAGSGAFLSSLRRTASGSFRVDECLSIGDAVAMLNCSE